MDKLILDETNYSLSVLNNNLIIDLGGLGKGFAIDKVCELLNAWEIENALLHSGGSTVKAIGKLKGYDGWPISISNPINNSQTIAEIILKHSSLSGSGKQKGNHIINPKTSLPITNRAGAWATSNLASISDAMSTTFMIMSIEDITNFCGNHNPIAGLIINNDIENKDNIFVSNNFIGTNILI